MKEEWRRVVHDHDLGLEAYHLTGVLRPFPNHFHEYYVIGFIERGKRRLTCKNHVCTVGEGDMLLFHPGDNHGCVQDGGALDYRGINIPAGRMLSLTEDVTGRHELPGFSQNVISDGEALCYLRRLHSMVMDGSGEFEKEENLLLLLSLLMQKYGRPFENGVGDWGTEAEKACAYMRRHYMERIGLEQICQYAGLSKSTLLRVFTKFTGLTPYRYLESIRVQEAKRLLEEGIPPVEAAMRTGFSDQSHFTRYFTSFIGLSPGMYREIFVSGEEDGFHAGRESPPTGEDRKQMDEKGNKNECTE